MTETIKWYILLLEGKLKKIMLPNKCSEFFWKTRKKDGTSVRAFFVLELRVFSFQLDIWPAQCNLARGIRFNSYHYHLYHYQGGG